MAGTNEQQMIEFMLKTMEQSSAMTRNMADAGQALLASFVQAYRTDPTVKRMQGEKLRAVYCDSKRERDELSSRMKAKQIPFILTRGTNGKDIIIIRDKDKERLDALHRDFKQREKTGFISKQNLWDRSGGEVKKYSGLTSIQAYLISQKAREANIGVVLQERKQGDYEILFDSKDGLAMAKAATSTAYDLAGESGKIYEKQLNYEEQNRCRIAANTISRFQPEFYVVDKEKNILKVSEHTVECEVGSIQQTLIKAGHTSEINTLVANMKHPVDLTPEQFKEYAQMPEEKKEKYLEKIDKMHGAPELTQADRTLLAKKEQDRAVVEKSLLRDNPAQDYIQASFGQGRRQSFIDAINADHENTHEESDIVRADPGLMEDAKAIQRGFVMTEEERTPEMDDREEWLIEHQNDISEFMKDNERDRDREDAMSFMESHDMDGNGLLDEYEGKDDFGREDPERER